MRSKRDSDHPQIVANDLDDLFNEPEDSDDEGDESDDEADEVASLLDTNQPEEEDNHWLVRSVKRIRRSINGLFGHPSQKLDDDVEEHSKKMHKRKGGKGKVKRNKNKKNKANKDKKDVKARHENPSAQLDAKHKPVARVRRQHVISHDDEDLADGSGSGSFDATNRQCE